MNKTWCFYIVPLCASLLFAETPEAVPAASLGWEWLYAPRSVSVAEGPQIVILSEQQGAVADKDVMQAKEGMLEVLFSRKAGERYRVVAFNEKNERIPTAQFEFGPGKDGYMVVDRIHRLGVEKTSDAEFLQITSKAAKEAQEAGLPVLPYALKGQPYEFDLKDSNGVRATSSDLRGKVVVIDAWTTWCVGCMQIMPALVSLSEKHAGDLKVISVCRNERDKDSEAKEKIASLPASWHHLHIPLDAPGAQSWSVAFAGEENMSFPRMVIINKEGKVDSILDTAGLRDFAARVEELIGKKK